MGVSNTSQAKPSGPETERPGTPSPEPTLALASEHLPWREQFTEPCVHANDSTEFREARATFLGRFKGISRAEWENTFNTRSQDILLHRQPGPDDAPRDTFVLWYGRDGMHADYTPINAQAWSELKGRPELLEQATQVLADSYKRAVDFYDWGVKKSSFIVEALPGMGMEGGKREGIRVGFDNEVKHLIEALKDSDPVRIHRNVEHIAASFVHEMTHTQRDESVTTLGTELGSHIAQYVFKPTGNPIFEQQLDQGVKQYREKHFGIASEYQNKMREPYPEAQYRALRLIADAAAETNPDLRRALEADPCPCKTDTLAKMGGMLTDADLAHLRAGLIQRVMQPGSDLLGDSRKIAG